MENLRLLLLPLCVLILLPWKTEKTELTFMDVGQGDGIYMDCGEHILIDSGSSSSRHIGEYTAEPFLQSKAVGRLEHVFVTHADGDHKNGIEYLLNNDRFSIETLYLPWQAQRDEKYDSLSESSAGKIKYLKAGDVLEIGRGRIYCLSPESSEEISDTNEQSLVLLYEEGAFKALLTGDAGCETEKKILKKYRLPEVTVLKCGHHGSRSSTSGQLLDEIKPLAAVLSYGKDNRYGHPHNETLENLKQRGIPGIGTAERGAISFYTNGENISTDFFITDAQSQ